MQIELAQTAQTLNEWNKQKRLNKMAKRNNAVYPARSDSTDEKKVFGKLNPYYGNRFCVSNSTVNEANEKKMNELYIPVR